MYSFFWEFRNTNYLSNQTYNVACVLLVLYQIVMLIWCCIFTALVAYRPWELKNLNLAFQKFTIPTFQKRNILQKAIAQPRLKAHTFDRISIKKLFDEIHDISHLDWLQEPRNKILFPKTHYEKYSIILDSNSLNSIRAY